MKLKNILFIIFFVSIIMVFITCAAEISQTTLTLEEAIILDYPVPDDMITDKIEKESMIKAKIKQLEAINSIYWGELPAEKERLIKVIQNILAYTDRTFPGFKGLGLDWSKFEKETLKKAKKIKNYGDFLSILTKITFNLKEGHSEAITHKLSGIIEDENPFELEYELFRENAPIFFTNIHLTRIGACYVITDKEELVITRTIDENNPYNFKQSDEIVGFNGIPWQEWYHHLLEANIPIYGSAGASEGAIKYNLLESGMVNVNLFEKINIKRYDTGKIETLKITFIEIPKKKYDYFDVYSREYVCTDLISDIPNISYPHKVEVSNSNQEKTEDIKETDFKDAISSGIIEGKNIGYIYLTKFPTNLEEFGS